MRSNRKARCNMMDRRGTLNIAATANAVMGYRMGGCRLMNWCSML